MDAMLLLLGVLWQLPHDRLLRAARATAARVLLVSPIYVAEASARANVVVRRCAPFCAADASAATRIKVEGRGRASLRARRGDDRPVPPSARPAREVGLIVAPAGEAGSIYRGHTIYY